MTALAVSQLSHLDPVPAVTLDTGAGGEGSVITVITGVCSAAYELCSRNSPHLCLFAMVLLFISLLPSPPLGLPPFAACPPPLPPCPLSSSCLFLSVFPPLTPPSTCCLPIFWAVLG